MSVGICHCVLKQMSQLNDKATMISVVHAKANYVYLLLIDPGAGIT